MDQIIEHQDEAGCRQQLSPQSSRLHAPTMAGTGVIPTNANVAPSINASQIYQMPTSNLVPSHVRSTSEVILPNYRVSSERQFNQPTQHFTNHMINASNQGSINTHMAAYNNGNNIDNTNFPVLGHSQHMPINNSDSHLNIQQEILGTNAQVLIHSDSQKSLDELFDMNLTQNAIPLRQRNLPNSFFNPTPSSNIVSGANHSRSMSYHDASGIHQYNNLNGN